MEVYEDLKSATDEVIRVFELAGIQINPGLIVGIAQTLCMMRFIEKNQLPESTRQALINFVKKEKGNGGIVE